MSEHYTVSKMVKKLVGSPYPVGDSRIDEQALRNLNTLLEIVDELNYDIVELATTFSNDELSSRAMIGEVASDWVNETARWLNEMDEVL